MRLPHVTTLLALFGLIAPLQAQQPAVAKESVSHEMVVEVLTQLNSRFSVEDWKYNVEVGKRPFKLYLLDNGKHILLKASIKGEASLETLNRYNEKTAATSRAVRYEKFGVILESGIDCQLGVTEAGLKKFIARFVGDAREFEKFVAANQDKNGKVEPSVAAKAEKQKPPLAFAEDTDEKEFVITYPTNQPKNWATAWKIVWDMESRKQANEQGFKFRRGSESPALFKIKQAYFKPAQKAEWIQVLEDAHRSEFYVPIIFAELASIDLRNVGELRQAVRQGRGRISQPLSKAKNVMAELRDTGVAYKHGNITRRGEELTLWANFGAANYTYMVEYGFRDDGTIVFRHAPTGYNYFDHFDASHMHGSYWRIGVKLGPRRQQRRQPGLHRPAPAPNPRSKGTRMASSTSRKSPRKVSCDWDAAGIHCAIRITNPELFPSFPRPIDRPPCRSATISSPLRKAPPATNASPTRNSPSTISGSPARTAPKKCTSTSANTSSPRKASRTRSCNPRQEERRPLARSSALHMPRTEDGIIGGKQSQQRPGADLLDHVRTAAAQHLPEDADVSRQ